MTVRTILLWPALKRAPKYRQLAELQDQLDRTADALGVKIPNGGDAIATEEGGDPQLEDV